MNEEKRPKRKDNKARRRFEIKALPRRKAAGLLWGRGKTKREIGQVSPICGGALWKEKAERDNRKDWDTWKWFERKVLTPLRRGLSEERVKEETKERRKRTKKKRQRKTETIWDKCFTSPKAARPVIKIERKDRAARGGLKRRRNKDINKDIKKKKIFKSIGKPRRITAGLSLYKGWKEVLRKPRTSNKRQPGEESFL